MTGGNFYQLFKNCVAEDPDAAMIELENGASISRRELDTLAGRYATALRSADCQAGEVVAAQLGKSLHAFALYLGCLRAGICYLPLNTAYQSAELAYLLGDARPKLFFRELEASGLADGTVPASTVLHTLGNDGGGTFAKLLRSADEALPVVIVQEEDAAALLYTSGTTGRPKGAVLSHRALRYSASTLANLWGITSSDVLLHVLPIFHSHGLFISLNTAISVGARVVLRAKFDAPQVAVDLGRATLFMGVPTFYHRLLALTDLTREACAKMRLFVCGSAPLPPDVHRQFEARTGHRILERYGSTEAMIICSNPLEGDRRAGSVGRPLPGLDVRIADKEDAPLPDGEIGMIQVRGPGLFTAYLNKVEQTALEFTTDGYFRSGDLGKKDSADYYYITGREKDLIISGGYNIYPAEVEAVIDDLPAVLETAVVAGPHPDFGECVVAFVVPQDPSQPPRADEVIQAVRSTLANYKVPKEVHIVGELPRNTMGKVMKNELRALLVASG